MTISVREVPAGEFNARCLRLMDEVRASGQPLVITKRGKPVARLLPVEDEPPMALFGRLKGHSMAPDDLIEPTGEAWDAETGKAWPGQE